jgi:hypothetical protein
LLARILLAQVLFGALAATAVARELHHAPSAPTVLSSASPVAAPASPRVVRPGLVAPASTTTSAPHPAVAPVAALHAPSAVVTFPAPFGAAVVPAIRALKGVDAVEVVDVGTVGLQGAPAVTVGVDPSTFRDFTPAVSATADRLWQYVADGTLASSFEMSRDRKLGLGVEVPVAAAGSGAVSQQWLGAFMSVGLPGVDLVVSRRLSGPLGLAPDTGLIVSAPSLDPFALQTALKAVAPGVSVVLLRPGLALGSTAGGGKGTLTTGQLSTALTAALSRLGKPYVWGGTGPDAFDCSGLVGWSFAAAGVDLPRTAAEQALAGPAVPLSQLQPGDLLFWSFDPADPAFIDHVAIYLGRGQMIEAPQTGYTVHVVAMERSHLVGAVRINPAISARLGSPWRH